MTPARSGARGVRLPALVRALRPRQWLKNVLVLAAPLASGRLSETQVQLETAAAFVAFSLAASGVYLANDLRDVETDRAHPVKRSRAIAAGEVRPRTAAATATLLLIAAVAVSLATAAALTTVVVVYVVMAIAYTLVLRSQPVLDLAVIAAGFVLRALAGGAASDIGFSPWFLLVAAFGSLFMAAGKRASELRRVGTVAGVDTAGGAVRASLASYSEGYLRFVWVMSATVAVMTYCLWAIEVSAGWSRPVLAEVSIVPFVLAILRYGLHVERGAAEAPEDVVLDDRVLQGLGLTWVVLFAAGGAGG